MQQDPDSQPIVQLPPSDIERVQVLGRLIADRISELDTAKASGSFTADQARELYVLEQLRDGWLLEGSS